MLHTVCNFQPFSNVSFKSSMLGKHQLHSQCHTVTNCVKVCVIVTATTELFFERYSDIKSYLFKKLLLIFLHSNYNRSISLSENNFENSQQLCHVEKLESVFLDIANQTLESLTQVTK